VPLGKLHKEQYCIMIQSKAACTMQQLAFILTCLSAGKTLAAPGDVLWMDDFSSSPLNSAYWSYDTGTGVGGWGNQELQSYTSDTANVNVSDAGQLEITALRNSDGSGFTSGRIKTEGKMTFTYGTVEASIKVPNVADGLWPAFWTLGYNFQEVAWPRSGEIDIMEIGQGLAINQGVVNRRVVTGAHWENEEAYATYAIGYDGSEDLYLDFHNFTLDWTPSMMTTYVDGQKMWEMNITSEACTDCEEFHHPHFLLFNLGVGGFFTSTGGDGSSGSSGVSSSSGCAGSSSAGVGSSSSGGCGSARTDVTATLPATMTVDYVKIVDNGFALVESSTTTPPDNGTEPPDNIFDPYPTDAPVVAGEPAAPVYGPTSAPTVAGTRGATEAPFPVIEFGDEEDAECAQASGKGGSGKGGSGEGGSGKGGSGKGERKRRRRLCSTKSSKSSKGDSLASRNDYLASSSHDQGYDRMVATGCTVAALAFLAQ
jgi:beta-glucanase (GH16 family)